jgi:hypothetical protein
MANPKAISLQLAAAVSNGIALAQQPLAAGALTLNGALVSGGVATMDVGRRISIASTGSDASVVFTITGTDNTANQNIISETITGVVSGTPVASLGNYKTITRVTSSAGTAGNITVGTNTVGSTVWLVFDFLRNPFNVGGGITGAAATTYTLEVTYDDPNSVAGQQQVGAEQWSMFPGGLVPAHVYTYAGISAASGDSQFALTTPIFAARLTINSGTGLVTLEAIQAGIT